MFLSGIICKDLTIIIFGKVLAMRIHKFSIISCTIGQKMDATNV